MKPMTLERVAEWAGGVLSGGEAGSVVVRVSTDSRQSLAGALFVPLVGERHDAHDFLPQAFAGGAVAALSARDGAAAGPLIRVDDGTGPRGFPLWRWG